MSLFESVFTIGRAKIGPGWSVFASREFDRSDEIGNFTSQRSAQDWIDTKSRAWLDERIERK
jgi:hypothetical protein